MIGAQRFQTCLQAGTKACDYEAGLNEVDVVVNEALVGVNDDEDTLCC